MTRLKSHCFTTSCQHDGNPDSSKIVLVTDHMALLYIEIITYIHIEVYSVNVGDDKRLKQQLNGFSNSAIYQQESGINDMLVTRPLALSDRLRGMRHWALATVGIALWNRNF